MSKPSVTNVIPDDIRSQDSMDNQVQAFLVAMRDILDTQCKMMMDKDNYVERERVEKLTLPKGWKVIST
jgi:hypothetical protein